LATLNRLRGEDHPKKRAELLHELLEQFEKERLTTLIPETNHELEQLLALLEQENDLKAQLERQMQQERDALPVILNFVLSASEAQRVEAILETYHEDLNLALVLVCQEVADGTKAVD
jgi:rubrerythrin